MVPAEQPEVLVQKLGEDAVVHTVLLQQSAPTDLNLNCVLLADKQNPNKSF